MSETLAVEAPAAMRRRNRSGPRSGMRLLLRTKLLFLAPGVILFTVVMIVPIFVNLFYSFTNWDGFGDTFDLVGGANFVRALTDPQAHRAFVNTIIFTAINAPLQIALGLVLALSLRRPGRLTNVLRTVVIFPIAISGVVLGFLGDIVFDPRSGILHALSGVPVLGVFAQNWLGDPHLAMGAIIAMNLWQWAGLTMLIFLAGLATLPPDLYEAATLDGASPWQRFRDITWPLLAPAVTINVVLTAIGGLKVFDIIYVLTGGGPGNATQSVVMLVAAQTSFASYGYSAAISFILTVVILIVALALLGGLRARETRTS